MARICSLEIQLDRSKREIEQQREEFLSKGAKATNMLCDADARIAELERQQAVLVDAIAQQAATVGIINQETAVSGPQALLLLQDLRAALDTVKPAVCETCNGHGMIGGFINAANGYDAEPCPDCSTVKPAARKTCAARGFMFGNDDACWFYCVGGGCGSDEPCEHQLPAGQEGEEKCQS